jgi:hypothetical protein
MIVIMPGGFHPFHAGHFALYQSAKQAFPDADVYVAATNDMSERPFPFALKEKLAKLAGVDAGHFIQVKSPFKAEEITKNYDPNSDVLVFVRSEKDRNEQPKPGGTKKDGSPAYFQPWTGKNVQPFGKHAYMAYLPTVEFGPGITSATQIRKAWPTLNDKRKTALVMSLYPAAQKNSKLAQNVVGMFDQVMGAQQVTEGFFGIDSRTKGAIQNVVSQLSDIPGMWDHKAQTFTPEGLEKLKVLLKNEPKYIKYALNLTADDYEAEGVAESALKDKADLDAKRKALQDMEREPGHDKEAIRQRKLDLEKEARAKGLSEEKSDVIARTAKDLKNPPKIMQHRAKRDMDREETYRNAQFGKDDLDDEGDVELQQLMRKAQQHYPTMPGRQQAFIKFVQRALKHSEEEDTQQDQEIKQIKADLNKIEQDHKKIMKVSESSDYLEEK